MARTSSTSFAAGFYGCLGVAAAIAFCCLMVVAFTIAMNVGSGIDTTSPSTQQEGPVIPAIADRDWRTAYGSPLVRGRFHAVDENDPGVVLIIAEDGGLIRATVSELSATDRAYLWDLGVTTAHTRETPRRPGA